MKKILFIIAILANFSLASFAEETAVEKSKAKVDDLKRDVKRKAHRAEEKICTKSKMECAKLRAEHHAKETSEYMKDTSRKVKNKVDSEKE